MQKESSCYWLYGTIRSIATQCFCVSLLESTLEQLKICYRSFLSSAARPTYNHPPLFGDSCTTYSGFWLSETNVFYWPRASYPLGEDIINSGYIFCVPLRFRKICIMCSASLIQVYIQHDIEDWYWTLNYHALCTIFSLNYFVRSVCYFLRHVVLKKNVILFIL